MKPLKQSALMSLPAAPALAHPGHGANPVTHWVADLSHLAVTAGLAALTIVAVGALVARRRARGRRKSDETTPPTTSTSRSG